MPNTIGPVIIDLDGYALTEEERELLAHPQVGGIILFARNYESPAQITALCNAIRLARKKPLLITVDQEGGRVQRFREGFTRLPRMHDIGVLHEKSPTEALRFAFLSGWLMAAELLAVGVDLSFAPVLDLNKNLNTVITDRAFAAHPDVVIPLARELIRGMREAGMAATGKHFPGHGSVHFDSHLVLPIDDRSLTDVTNGDMQTFAAMITSGLDAIMPAHILFSEIDSHPVGFSEYWLKRILREQLKFSGVIFSDDLYMEGASVAGNYAERATAALTAGCDMVLICNYRKGAIQIVDELPPNYAVPEEKWSALQGKSTFSWDALQASKQWQESTSEYRKYYDYTE